VKHIVKHKPAVGVRAGEVGGLFTGRMTVPTPETAVWLSKYMDPTMDSNGVYSMNHPRSLHALSGCVSAIRLHVHFETNWTLLVLENTQFGHSRSVSGDTESTDMVVVVLCEEVLVVVKGEQMCVRERKGGRECS
jgi:hypothetical protein